MVSTDSVESQPFSTSASQHRKPRVLRWCLTSLVLLLLGWWLVGWWVSEQGRQNAREALRVGEYGEALKQLAWCRWVSPFDGDLWLLSARVSRRAGQLEQAASWLEIAARRGALSTAVALERTLQFAVSGRFEEVEDRLIDWLDHTRTDFPLIAEVLTGEYMRQYRLPEARSILDRWLELDPENVEPWLRRAWVLERQLNADAAINDYRKVLQLDTARPLVRLQLVDLLLKVRKPRVALMELQPLLQTPSPSAEVVSRLARCHRELGQFDQAQACLDTVPAQQQTARIRLELAQLALEKGEFQQAEMLFRQVLEELPRERELLFGLIRALTGQGKIAEAEKVELQLRAIDEDSRRMSQLMAELARKPRDPALRFECAQIFLRSGLKEDAIRWLHLTLETAPSHRQAHTLLAELYQQQGNEQRAAYHRHAAKSVP
jgi:predicted Zn-dependent protease